MRRKTEGEALGPQAAPTGAGERVSETRHGAFPQCEIDSELRLKALLESVMAATDVMLVYLDRDFNFVWVNDAYAASCKMKPADMLGKNHFALYPHEENEAIFRRVRDTGEAVFYKDKPFEFPDQPERGVTYWDWSLSPVKDARGRVAGMVVSLRETTPFKRTARDLSESEARLTRTQEIAHLGSWELDIVRDALTWSDETYRIFGLRPQEFEATYEAFLERVHPDDRAAVDAAYSTSVRDGKDGYEIEHRVIRASTGEVRWVQEKCEHIRDSSGKTVNSRGMVLDITERKHTREEVERLNRELERRVEERTEALRASLERMREQQAQLRRLGRRLAQVREEERHRIGLGLHDEVGQLLVACQYQLEAARRKPNESIGHFDAAERLLAEAAEHIRELVFELRCPTLHEFGLPEAVRELADRMGAMFGIPIAVVADDAIKALPRNLRSSCYHAVRELLFNVYKHAKASQATVFLDCPDGTARIAVEDDGVGFDPSFDPRTTHAKGIGLLHLREQFMALGGGVAVESHAGKGACVTIRIPIKKNIDRAEGSSP